jgi:very-short-patch-repair endonuclease
MVSRKSIKVKRKAELISLRRRLLTQRATSAEITMRSILDSLNLKYRFQAPFFTHKSFYITDFYIKGYKLVVEVDGLHHLRASQAKYDIERTRLLEKRGLTVLRFMNDEVVNIPDLVKQGILRYKMEYEKQVLIKHNRREEKWKEKCNSQNNEDYYRL